MLKILAIGNSFSQDATYYLKNVADSAGVDVKAVDLYIGGCSLEMHNQNIKNNDESYSYELNGVCTGRMTSIQDALKEDEWDIVTIQQVSFLAGVYESYGEDLIGVLDCIKEYAPQAKIYIHETWAYEIDNTSDGFARFDCNQEQMAASIENTVERISKENGNIPIIPCGRAVRKLRRNPLFDYQNGGESVCRDGYHMSLAYGRYLTALVWFATLLKGDVDAVTFLPNGRDDINGHAIQNFNCDNEKINLIKDVVKSFSI